METELLHEFACPNCRAPLELGQDHVVLCAACHSRFVLRGRLCPVCAAYHENEEAFCGRCGTVLQRTCQKCRTANWAGSEYCKQCRQPMGILDLLSRHHSASTADRLNRQMEQARHVQQLEQLASDRRMSELTAIEQARQANIRRRAELQRKRDRQLLLFVAGAIGTFFLALAIYAIIGFL